MTSGVVLNFSHDPSAIPEGPALSADPLVAEVTGTPNFATYGRAVWPTVRDLALGWRRTGSGVPLVRAGGDADAMWWAAVDGAFEARGGVVDMLYRALVIDAVLSDRPGPVVALGAASDPWLAAVTAVCRSRSRELVVRASSTATRGKTGSPTFLRRAGMMARRSAGIARGRSARADLLLVLAHGHMARRTPSGRLADVYTRDFFDPLQARVDTAVMSLEPPTGMELHDLSAIVTGAYRPWTTWCSLAELRATSDRRNEWSRRLQDSDTFALSATGIDLGPALAARAVPIAARGLSIAQLYEAAFRRACDQIAPQAVLSTEGHSNVGRVLGAVAPNMSIIAPQAGVIGRDAVTNAAYDHRGLTPLSDDGRTGCPVPSHALVWGDHYARLLSTFGHRSSAVHVTGFPRETPANGGSGGGVLFVAGANDDVCAFASSFSEEIVAIRAVARATRRRVRVRLHPTHRLERYRAVLGMEVDLSHPASRSLAEDLATAHVVVGKSSTALVEASIGGWPAVIINLGPTPDLTGFGDAGLPVIEAAEGLTGAIEGAATDGRAAVSLASPRGQRSILDTVDLVAKVVAG